MVVVPDDPATPADWAAIYAQHGQALRIVASASIGGPGEILGKTADDIVFDVIAELMTNRQDRAKVTNPSYLKTAVRNRVRDLHERSKFERPEAIDPDEAVEDEDMEAAVDRAELADQAAGALDELPERERYAIVEHVMKCRPGKAVGPELGVKPQRVSQLVNAGLGRLRKLPTFTELLSPDGPLPDPSRPAGPDETGTPS